MFLHYGLVILVYHTTAGLSSPVTYDQRQTGDLNVQIHLKDVQVVALVDSELLDDYTEYDYFYDYADFTVKPIGKPTTTSTTVATVAASSSGSADKENVTESLDSSAQSSTIGTPIFESSGENITLEVPSIFDSNRTGETTSVSPVEDTEKSSTASSTLNASIDDRTTYAYENDNNIATATKSADTVYLPTERPVSRLSKKRCRSGYSPDGKGRCRRLSRRRLSLIPLALKLAPRFLEDLPYNVKTVQ